MCERIRIRMKKAYFDSRHMDLVWYGRKGIVNHFLGVFERL
jgi:hypothetical protein